MKWEEPSRVDRLVSAFIGAAMIVLLIKPAEALSAGLLLAGLILVLYVISEVGVRLLYRH
jgi:hypothetical protein